MGLLAQAPSTAYKLGVDGIQAIESGETSAGIKLLKEAWSLEPSSYDYPFEIGRALLLEDNAKKAEKYLFPLQYHQNVQPDLYIHLADCYKQIDEEKKTPDQNRKKELDALRYGIQKLPDAGELYLELGKRKIEMEQHLDALSVFESGIANAPNFADNYFWAAKLMKASSNPLWTWIYAELFINISDNDEMIRTAMELAATAQEKVFSGSWKADPEKMDQELQYLLSKNCTSNLSGTDRTFEMRRCIMNEWRGTAFAIAPLIKRFDELEQNGFLDAYSGSLMLQSNKEAFLAWLASNGERYEAFRRWRFYNPMFITEPVKRVN
ncbi:MAG: hypothetical protein KDB98_00730 [Flavobacteriales bacterium]|nr:hypothetical protein [Flavobacteriales bacterium]